MKKILFMAMMAGSLLACNKQDNATDPDETKGENSVILSVNQAALQGRSITDQKGSSEYAVIASAKIYFIDNSGNNIHQRELTASEITALANTTGTAGGKTVTITGIPNTATTLYFIANLQTAAGTTLPPVTGTGKAGARFRVDQLQGNALNVPMAGQSTTFVPVSGNIRQYTTSVELTPLVARFELGQVTCQNQNGASAPAVNADITGYKLSGVFMNNIHQDILLDGTPYLTGTPIDIRNQAGWATSYDSYFNSYNTDFPYYVGGNPLAPSGWVHNAMCDYCTPSAAAMTFYPDASSGAVSTAPSGTPKAWAYQVCPSLTVSSGTPADVPHLILKLTEVTYENNDLGSTTLYVTVTKYMDGSSNPVTEFKRGNVYRIENLVFTHDEATGQPYEENITVTATVSVKPWTINTVNPDWR